jgi:hypothetical protein
MGQRVHMWRADSAAFALFQRFAWSSLLGTPLIAQPFILFSDCQSPAAARWCKRSQVTPTPTHPHSSLSSPRAPHTSAKWGVDVDDEEGIWTGAFQRADGCMYGRTRVTDTTWGRRYRRGQAPRGSAPLLIMRDRSRDPIVFAFVTAWRVLEAPCLRNTLHSPLFRFPPLSSFTSSVPVSRSRSSPT